MTYHLNISDCFLNALTHYSFPVDYHSICTPPWVVDVVGDMVAEIVADPFCFPRYVEISLQVTRRETNIAKTLAIPVPRTLITLCMGVTLSVQHFYTVLKFSEDALQIIVIYIVSEAFLSLQISVLLCSGLADQILG